MEVKTVKSLLSDGSPQMKFILAVNLASSSPMGFTSLLQGFQEGLQFAVDYPEDAKNLLVEFKEHQSDEFVDLLNITTAAYHSLGENLIRGNKTT